MNAVTTQLGVSMDDANMQGQATRTVSKKARLTLAAVAVGLVVFGAVLDQAVTQGGGPGILFYGLGALCAAVALGGGNSGLRQTRFDAGRSIADDYFNPGNPMGFKHLHRHHH